MKRILIMLALATAAAFALDAQIFPLMEARKVLQGTKGFAVTGQVTQKEVDTNDSTCRLGIVSFELPAKRAKVFDKVVEEYNRESPLSDGSHSFVADLGIPAAERDAVPGIKAVKFYYFQGRPYIRTGDGHNFVSVRRNLDNSLYRTTTCIEWWPEDTLGFDGDRLLYGKVAGRIITVKGPIGDKAYVQKSESVKQNNDGECFVALQEVLELVRMYSLRESALQKEAVINSINRRIETIVSSVGHKDHEKHIKNLLSALSDLPSYRCDVVFSEGSGIPDRLNVPISNASLCDVAGIRFFPRESPESSKYGEQSADGLFVIKARTIKYDKSAPPLKVPYLSKPSKNYNPYNGRTFPVYTGFSTIPFPPEDEEDEGFGKCALWCTADSTYLVTYSRVRSNAHYWHHIHDDKTLRDRFTGKEYPLRSIWGVPVDTTYFISGHTNDIVCFVSVYDALPPTATTIDILNKDGRNVPTPKGGTGWAPGKSCYNISVADLQKNQQKIIGAPWIINRPDKVRRYIVDGRVATRDDADKVSDIETIKLCSDGQLFLFSKVPEDVKTVPYYFISYNSAHYLTILVKMLPEGTIADASYSLEDIGKMLNVGLYTNINLEVLESDCKTSVVDSIRSYLDDNENRYLLFRQFKTRQEDQFPLGKVCSTLCPGHKVVTHTVHLDADNHFILDGEDIIPRTLYGRVLRIVEREGETSLCVFKISCEPESSFNYYCQVVKNMQRAQSEIRSRMQEVLTPVLVGNRSQSTLINTVFIDLAPIRICEEAYYEEGKNNNPLLQFHKQLLMDLSVTIDGVKHPELRDFDAILDYIKKEGRLIDSVRYFSNGKELDLAGGRLSLSGEDEKYEVVMTTVQKTAK